MNLFQPHSGRSYHSHYRDVPKSRYVIWESTNNAIESDKFKLLAFIWGGICLIKSIHVIMDGHKIEMQHRTSTDNDNIPESEVHCSVSLSNQHMAKDDPKILQTKHVGNVTWL